jgi:T5SS/PEP-CTERM-associated repeat protein
MKNRFNLSTCSACLCILLAAVISASAQTVWTDGTGSWFTPANWSAGVPTAGTTAEVNNGGTAQIAGASAAAASGLALGNGGGTGSVSVNGASALNVGASISVSGATSLFSINGASAVTSSFGTMNQGGTATINGGSSWVMSQTLLIGNGTGTATFNENGGSAVSAADVSLGVSLNSTATATIDGGSTLSMTGELHVGTDGTATLNILGGSGVSDSVGVIGYDNTANGTVNVSGATSWTNTGDMTVGKFGHGTLHITNGGTVSDVNGVVGSSVGSTGTVTLDTAMGPSSWDNTGSLVVGDSGTGTVNVLQASTLTSASGTIGNNLNSTGTVTVDGLFSTWIMTGNLTIGSGGSGTLNVTNSGKVQDADAFIGLYASGVGIVNVDGNASTWNNSNLYVGDNGTGTLNIRNNGVASSTNGYVGHLANAIGTVNVSTGGLWANGSLLTVGDAGHGTLNIQNEGDVTSVGGIIGSSSSSTGVVNVTGTGKWAVGGVLTVAADGTGTLNIQDTGVVENTDSAIGDAAGSVGKVNVSGSGIWSSNGILTVGNSGAGTLTITGSGDVFSNANNFIANHTGSVGTVIVDGGTWNASRVYVGGNVGGAGGTGLLRIQNGGTVSAIANTTIWSSGTLEIGVNPTLIGTMDFQGGTLRTIANTSFGGVAQLGPGGGILDSNGFTSTLDIAFHFPGALTKIGAGTMNSIGSSDYSGGTTINAGALGVGSTNALGTGNVVVNGGILQSFNGPRSINVGGTYTQNAGGTLRLQIGGTNSGSESDFLTVGGLASLNGTLSLVRINNFTPAAGDRVDIIGGPGGHTGVFADVISTFNGVLRPVVHYDDPADVYILFQMFSFNVGGLTPNQTAVAQNLDLAVNDPAAAPLINFLAGQPGGNLPHDYDLIAPEELAAMYEVGFSQAMVQNNNLERRMDDIRAGSNGFCANNFVAPSGKDADGGKVVLPAKDGPEVYVPTENNRWGVFLNGSGESVNVGEDDFNARGYEITSGNFTLGADYRMSDHFAIGVNGGYANSQADLVNDGRIDVDGGKIGAYATVFGKGFFGGKIYIDGAIGGGLNSYDTLRIGLQNELVRGDTDGSEFNGMISYGSDWTFGCFNIGTWSTIQYTRVNIDEFTEIGSLAPLEIQDQSEDSLRSTSGIRASYDIKAGRAIFRPEIRAAWQHEHGDRGYQVDSRLASGAGGVFRVHGPEVGRDAALVGTGFSLQWNNRFSTYVYYDGVLGRGNYDNSAISGGLRVGF